jgi:hypothetical protein
VSELEGRSLNSSLLSLDDRVSAPPLVWSLVTGEPRDCLCIAQRERERERERGCFSLIDCLERGNSYALSFLIGEVVFTCPLILDAKNIFPFFNAFKKWR